MVMKLASHKFIWVSESEVFPVTGRPGLRVPTFEICELSACIIIKGFTIAVHPGRAARMLTGSDWIEGSLFFPGKSRLAHLEWMQEPI